MWVVSPCCEDPKTNYLCWWTSHVRQLETSGTVVSSERVSKGGREGEWGGDKHTESLFLFSNRDYETRHRLPTLSFLSHYLLHASIHPLSLSHTPRHKDEKERESKHEAISLPTRAQTALALTHVPANQTLLDVCFLEEQPASLNLCLRQQTGKRKRERESESMTANVD